MIPTPLTKRVLAQNSFGSGYLGSSLPGQRREQGEVSHGRAPQIPFGQLWLFRVGQCLVDWHYEVSEGAELRTGTSTGDLMWPGETERCAYVSVSGGEYPPLLIPPQASLGREPKWNASPTVHWTMDCRRVLAPTMVDQEVWAPYVSSLLCRSWRWSKPRRK
jgi:hypothetical protein